MDENVEMKNNMIDINGTIYKIGADFITMMDCENTYQKVTGIKMNFFDMLNKDNFNNTILLVLLVHGLNSGNRISGDPRQMDLVQVSNILNEYIKNSAIGIKSTSEITGKMLILYNQIVNIMAYDLDIDFLKSPTV
jgi:hypothetical protein